MSRSKQRSDGLEAVAAQSRRRPRVTMLPILATTFCVTTAHGAMLTYTGSFTGPTDVTNQQIQVQQFNASLGTLTGVSITLDGVMQTQLFTNNDGNFRAGWDILTYDLTLDGSGVLGGAQISSSLAPTRVVGTGTAGGSFGLVTVTCPGSGCMAIANGYKWTTTGPALSASGTFSDAAPGAQYVGNGWLNFLLSTTNEHTYSLAGVQTGGLPANVSGLSTAVTGNVSITYEYDAFQVPVPLPAAAWLLGSGLLGLLGVARRRRGA